jgi:hypothetical protein
MGGFEKILGSGRIFTYLDLVFILKKRLALQLSAQDEIVVEK